MNSYIDYDYYVFTFEGTLIPEEEFEKFSTMASNKVRTRIFDRDISLFENDVQFTTCLVVDILYNQKLNQDKIKNIINGSEKVITSEKVGDHSRNISTVSATDLQKISSNDYVEELVNQVLEDNLYLTGLLYCGGF